MTNKIDPVWEKMDTGKLILKGKIKLLSSLIIGGGNDDASDIDVIKDEKGNPFIPATSFIGALRHHLKDNYNVPDLDEQLGFSKENSVKTDSQGSLVYCSDLFPVDDIKPFVVVRDGIKINRKTRIVELGMKYDYEVIDSGAEFKFCLEAGYNAVNKDKLKNLFITIKNILTEDKSDFKIGAKTNSGLGRIKSDDAHIFDYDFSSKDNVIAWVRRNSIKYLDVSNDGYGFEKIQKKEFKIDAYFNIKTSLIQRSYSSDTAMPDAVHIKSGGKNILQGTGAKGAISSRAEMILNTLNDSMTKDIMNYLFGYVDEKSKKSGKGRMSIEENEIPGFVSEIQTRIKIDRFTGGTISGALFDEMPIFGSGEINMNERHVHLEIKIKDYKDYEAGLLLLALKDLWLGDLPIGGEEGIGRGVLQGIKADIIWNDGKVDKKVELKNDDLQKELLVLQPFVDNLLQPLQIEKAG